MILLGFSRTYYGANDGTYVKNCLWKERWLGMGLFGAYAIEHLENFFVNNKDERDIENDTGHTGKRSFV